MPIIEVNHLTKEYQLGHITSLKETALNAMRRLTFRPVHKRERFKALDDVSFTVEEGEVLGIIGHNGAGKSTLLKHLANISKPTKGKVIVRGTVAPLIEVGAGINPELTGRENIFLNGAILGMPKKIIKQKLDEIIDFSELEQFIDTPMKRYSSGMKIKLAFSIATSIDADVLIVDEVLAVGDLAFQRKCFDRMENLIKRQGRTVLLVSHNIRQVARMCSRVCLIDHGKIIADGLPSDVCEAFYEQSNQKIVTQATQGHNTKHNIRMSGEVDLEKIELLDENGNETQELVTGRPATIRCHFNANDNIENVEIIYGFHTTDFIYIASMGTAHLKHASNLFQGKNIIDCNIERVPLTPGVFAVRIGVFDQFRRPIFYGETLKVFPVRSENIPVTQMATLGVVDIPADWKFNTSTPRHENYNNSHASVNL